MAYTPLTTSGGARVRSRYVVLTLQAIVLEYQVVLQPPVKHHTRGYARCGSCVHLRAPSHQL
jgi:hypothetical protein